MKIIIPCSGIGSRFIEAGYYQTKPLIDVTTKKKIIDYVIDNFDRENDEFFFISGPTTYDDMNWYLSTLDIKYHHFKYEGEKLGPVGTIFNMREELGLHVGEYEPVIVSYCDYGMNWDYQEFLDYIEEVQPDVAIPCYTGYHPHLEHEENVYAACLTDEEDKVYEVIEKYKSNTPFEEHWSAGLYYFSSFLRMEVLFNELIEQDVKLNGEYYVSLACNYSNDVRAWSKIKKFYQFGTPRDFEEAKPFLNVEYTDFYDEYVTNTVVLSAGKGERFYGLGFNQPKPFLPIGESDLISQIEDTTNYATRMTFVGSDAHKNFWGNRNVRYVPSNSIGAAYSYRESCKDLVGSVLIVPCDLIADHIDRAFTNIKEDYDVIVFTARPSDFQRENPNSFSWVETGQDFESSTVQDISLKSRKCWDDEVLIGSFWVKDNKILIDSIDEIFEKEIKVNGEYYLDTAFKNLMKRYSVGYITLPHYYSFGTPSEYFPNKYWYEDMLDRKKK